MNDRLDENDITAQFVQDFRRYAVGAVIPAILGVAGIFILTRAFTPQLYGEYSLAMVFVTILATITTGWIGQSILRLEPELDADVLLSNALIAFAGSTVVFTVLGAGVYAFFPFDSLSHKMLFISGSTLVISRGFLTVTKSALQAQLDSRRATILRIGKSVGRLLIGLPLAIIVFNHPAGWILGSAIAIISVTTVLWHTSIEYPQLSFNRGTLYRIVSFGFPMIGWLLGFTLLTFVDRVLLEIFSNSRSVGLYTANYEVANKALPLVLAPLIQTSHPIIMNMWDGSNAEMVQETISDMTRYLLIVGVPATVLVALSSAPLSEFLLDSRYHEGHVIIPIIAASIFLWHVAMLAHKGLEVKEKTKLMLIGVTGATVTNIALNTFLIPQYGYLGAAGATFLSFAGYLGFAVVLAEQHIPWRPPLNTVRSVVLSTSIMAVFVHLVYRLVGSSLISLIGAALSGAIVYLVMLFIVGEFTEQELLTIREAFAKLL